MEGKWKNAQRPREKNVFIIWLITTSIFFLKENHSNVQSRKS